MIAQAGLQVRAPRQGYCYRGVQPRQTIRQFALQAYSPETVLEVRRFEVRELPEFELALREGRVVFLEFSGSQPCLEIKRRLAAESRGYQERTFSDYSGRELLSVISPPATSPSSSAD
jgi:hypothetical protein